MTGGDAGRPRGDRDTRKLAAGGSGIRPSSGDTATGSCTGRDSCSGDIPTSDGNSGRAAHECLEVCLEVVDTIPVSRVLDTTPPPTGV
jgi:hypothetical protein